MHHDQGGLGAKAYYDAIDRQLTILKDMGVNAVRVTHNPSSRFMRDIANRKGILLVDEAFDTWRFAKTGINMITQGFLIRK
ncbi:glycoside hydrolase family 2 TIM barrel-domain containing protein [Streptococcus iniae]